MAPFSIGPFTFASKREATEAVRRVLHGTRPGAALSGADLDLITALVAMHPDAEAKVGAGLDRIEVRVIEYGAPGFWLIRDDGSRTDFSYRKSLNRPSHRSDVLATMRRDIADQISDYRRGVFAEVDEVACPLTGERLTIASGVVDHHSPTFIELAAQFADVAGGWERIELIGGDGRIGKDFRHEMTRQGWQMWHQQHARLRYISAAANARRGA